MLLVHYKNKIRRAGITSSIGTIKAKALLRRMDKMTPQLQQATMDMSMTNKPVPKFVMLWKEVGLAIHGGGLERWRISHFASGKSILTGIKTKEKAIGYLQKIYDEVLSDWRFTLQEWEDNKNGQFLFNGGLIDKPTLKEKIDALQSEIRKEVI